jgi:hypothetical protein
MSWRRSRQDGRRADSCDKTALATEPHLRDDVGWERRWRKREGILTQVEVCQRAERAEVQRPAVCLSDFVLP